MSSSSLGGASSAADTRSIYSHNGSANYGRGESRDIKEGTRMHLVDSSELSARRSENDGASIRSERTGYSEGTATEKRMGGGSKGRAKSLAPTVPEHSIKFDEFHSQVRNV